MSDKSLESILRSSDFARLPGYVFAIDRDTKEVVYQNEAMDKLLHDVNAAYPAFDERFLSIRAYEATYEGRRCIVHVAITLAPHEHAVNGLDVRPAISDVETVLRREMKQSDFFLDQDRNFQETVADDIISLAMKFYKAPQAHFVQLQGNKGARLVQFGKGEPVVSSLPANPFSRLYQDIFFRRGFTLVIENVADFVCLGDGLAEALLAQNTAAPSTSPASSGAP